MCRVAVADDARLGLAAGVRRSSPGDDERASTHVAYCCRLQGFSRLPVETVFAVYFESLSEESVSVRLLTWLRVCRPDYTV